MEITTYHPRYAKQIADLFYDAVHIIASADYTEEELDAWAPPPDYSFWSKRLETKQPFIAIEENTVLGFGELEEGGHIDCFYIHKDHQRKGIGKALENQIEITARKKGYIKLFAEVSITAKPFFLSRGFVVVRPNLAVIGKYNLKNYLMEKQFI